jgi:hypothetical protein
VNIEELEKFVNRVKSLSDSQIEDFNKIARDLPAWIPPNYPELVLPVEYRSARFDEFDAYGREVIWDTMLAFYNPMKVNVPEYKEIIQPILDFIYTY